MNNALTS